MKSKSIIGLFFLCCIHTTGQVLNYFKDIQSPQVALMNRYGDYPVDFSTGLVDISIPLYTIQTTSLKIPLQLKFHASGLRADEREGLFGIRWALFGGGQVTRQIKGYPDEFYPFNSNANNPDRTPDFYDLYGTTSTMYENSGYGGSYNSFFISGGFFSGENNNSIQFAKGEYKDTEYDVFSYALPSGKSGRFIVQGTTGVPMPYEAIKIMINRDSKIKSMSIVDDDGTTYRFGGSYIDGNDDGWITTWHLYSMISANKQDTVQLNYIKPSTTTTFCNSSLIITDNLHAADCFEPSGLCAIYNTCAQRLVDPYYYFDQENCTNQKFTNTYRSSVDYTPFSISSIKFSEGGTIGQIDFKYQKNKYGQPTFIDTMIIRNTLNHLIQKIHFNIKSNQSGNLSFLDKIEFIDNANSNLYSYSLNYYDSPDAPICGKLMLNCDWWGYYSASAGAYKSGSIQVLSVDNYGNQRTQDFQTISGGDKHSDENSMKIGMIQSITYPTGGLTSFNYEANTYLGRTCGGLRIQSITNQSQSGKTESKSYRYDGADMPAYMFPPSTSSYNNIQYGMYNYFTENEVSCYARDNSVVVSDITGTAYAKCPYGGEARYTQRTFSPTVPNRFTSFNANVVHYATVTETITNNNNEALGKTIYEYAINNLTSSFYNSISDEIFEGYHDSGRTGYMHAYVSPSDFWKITALTKKTVYKGSAKLKEYQYEYTPSRIKSIYDMPVFRYRKHWINNINYGNNNDQEEIALIYPYWNDYLALSQTFAFKHQEYTIGADKLTKETETTYYDNGLKQSIAKEYTYDPNYLLPLTETITNSNGDIIKINKKYPFNAAGWVYSDMVAKNIINEIVQVDKYKNDTFVESTIFDYKPFPDLFESTAHSTYRPECIARRDATGQTELLIQHMEFSRKGTPVYQLKNEASKTVYLWGYNYQYMIAKIEGLTYDEVKAAVGETNINTLAVNPNPTKNDIEQIRSKITASGKQGMVTTYTYIPLIGMATATDPKGTTTNYTYDGFNRLKDISNHDTKILHEYMYHYNQ